MKHGLLLLSVGFCQFLAVNYALAQGGVDRGGGLSCVAKAQSQLCELTDALPVCSQWTNYDGLFSAFPEEVHQEFSDLLKKVEQENPGTAQNIQHSKPSLRFCILANASDSAELFSNGSPFLREDSDIILNLRAAHSRKPTDIALFLLKTLIPPPP
jgi:hypothetical protein